MKPTNMEQTRDKYLGPHETQVDGVRWKCENEDKEKHKSYRSLAFHLTGQTYNL